MGVPNVGLRAIAAPDQFVERIPQLGRFSSRQGQADSPALPIIRNLAVQAHASILSSERAPRRPTASAVSHSGWVPIEFEKEIGVALAAR